MKSLSVFNWRILIFKSNLPPNAKYIGCFLSTYMNEQGDNCFPSISRICLETGLSKPTVIKYIQVLKQKGWLLTKKKGFKGQSWAHNQYYPNIPKNVMEEIHCLKKEKAVKDINRLSEGGETESIRRLNSEHKAVKEVNTSSTDNSTDNSTEEPPTAVPVPYVEIVNLYHEKLPSNPHIASLTASRKAQIKARWRNGLPNLTSWIEYFDYVNESDFLTGKTSPSNGHKTFIANIDFLIKENNVVRIIEGTYHG